MALRQILDNAQEIMWLLERPGNRRSPPVRPSVETVWAIVFLFACMGRCGPGLSSPASGAYRAYDVLVTRHSDTYHPRKYRGLLATDGKRHRIAFYWLDPAAECDQTDALAFSDFLFYPDKVWYWHHKDPNQIYTLPLEPSRADQVGRLTVDKTLESILQSVFSIVVHNRAATAGGAATMETARFFQGARQRDRLDHTVEPAADEAARSSLSEQAQDKYTILNRLPFGRKYSKQIDQKGNAVWHVSKGAVAMDLVRVAVKPKPLCDTPGWSDMFDPNGLGRWSGVPEAYRQYWSFKHQSIRLRRTPSPPEAQRLYADIVSCLRGSLPEDANLALHKLAFSVSLETGSCEAMSSSARQYFHAYVRLAQEPVERILVELGSIAKELRKKWSDDQTRDFIRPLLKPLVDPQVFGDPGFVKELISRRIAGQGRTWSLYTQLVLESIQQATSLDREFLARLAQIVERPPRVDNVTDSDRN